jgi:hypothetical protein
MTFADFSNCIQKGEIMALSSNYEYFEILLQFPLWIMVL